MINRFPQFYLSLTKYRKSTVPYERLFSSADYIVNKMHSLVGLAFE